MKAFEKHLEHVYISVSCERKEGFEQQDEVLTPQGNKCLIII